MVARGHSVSDIATEPRERQPRNGRRESVECGLPYVYSHEHTTSAVHTDLTEYRRVPTDTGTHHLPGRLHKGLDGNHRT